jgi:hypothetical protein
MYKFLTRSQKIEYRSYKILNLKDLNSLKFLETPCYSNRVEDGQLINNICC